MAFFVGDMTRMFLLNFALFLLINFVVGGNTNGERTDRDLKRPSNRVVSDQFEGLSSMTDFYDRQQDESVSESRNTQEFRSETKTDIQWNELSEEIPTHSEQFSPEETDEIYADETDLSDVELSSKKKVTLKSSRTNNMYGKISSGSEEPKLPKESSDSSTRDYQTSSRSQLTPIVSTRYGRVQGAFSVVPGSSDRVAKYLGIPYATPPVNANRLSPTRAATQWRGVLAAVDLPPACPQKPPKHLQRLFQHQNEDCLYLNIYVPDGVMSVAVVVVIPGESYTWGSGSAYDGSVLANRGNLIVVTLNYRLGILGFLNPGSAQQRPTVANYGLMDQLAALHWLQENIASFGGDPAQVTVMGRGRAAAALNFLIISPAAAGAGLFKRAVMLSGSALSPWALVKDPAHYAQQTSEQLHCLAVNPSQPTIEEMIVCLRNRTVQEIMEVSLETPQFLSSMGPSVDGVTITHDWQQQMAKMGKEGRTPVDILLGVTEVEDMTDVFSTKEIAEGFSEDHRDRIFRTFVTNNYHFHLQELVLAITAEYTDWSRPSRHPATVRDRTAAALHDASVVAPATAAAAGLASKHRTIYFYVLDNRLRDQDPAGTPLTELSYILGSPIGFQSPILPSSNHSRADITVSEAFIGYVSNFVRSGHPSPPSPDESYPQHDSDRRKHRTQSWEQFDASFRRYLEIRASNPRIRDHYRADQVALWTWLIPGLERVGSRHGSNSTFHRFVGGPGIFSGPTRPNSFLPPPPTTSSPPETSPAPGDGALTQQRKNGTFRMAQDASVRDRHGHTSDSLLGVDDLGLPYTTALSLTAALGVTLLLLNVLVLAAVHYRKSSHHKVPHNRQQGLSPSHCGTLHSSTTLRSLACPQDWPPEYTTCFPENCTAGGAGSVETQMHIQKQLDSQTQQPQLTTKDEQERLQHHISSPQEQQDQLFAEQQQNQLREQQYQLHNLPHPIVEEMENTHQVFQHHLHLASTSVASPHHNQQPHHRHLLDQDDNNSERGSFRQGTNVHNSTSTIKLVRKPSPPPRSSSVPSPECTEGVETHFSQSGGGLVGDHDPG